MNGLIKRELWPKVPLRKPEFCSNLLELNELQTYITLVTKCRILRISGLITLFVLKVVFMCRFWKTDVEWSRIAVVATWDYEHVAWQSIFCLFLNTCKLKKSNTSDHPRVCTHGGSFLYNFGNKMKPIYKSILNTFIPSFIQIGPMIRAWLSHKHPI